jgi:hypothetical protein
VSLAAEGMIGILPLIRILQISLARTEDPSVADCRQSTAASIQLSTNPIWHFLYCRDSLGQGRKVMTDWKTNLDALVFETMAFAKTIHREQVPADLIERSRLQPLNWGDPRRA